MDMVNPLINCEVDCYSAVDMVIDYYLAIDIVVNY